MITIYLCVTLLQQTEVGDSVNFSCSLSEIYCLVAIITNARLTEVKVIKKDYRRLRSAMMSGVAARMRKKIQRFAMDIG